MPNRILKESICTSDDINDLTCEQEAFFYRLLVNCDDYGRFDARSEIIRSRLYPLKLDKVKVKDIESWLSVLVDKKMVFMYRVDGKPYLQIVNWGNHQQVRAKKSKFPAPANSMQESDIICNQVQEDDYICPRESESLSESINENPNPNTDNGAVIESVVIEEYNQICESMPKVQQASDKRKRVIKSRLKEYTLDQICEVFQKAENSEFLSGRNGKWTGCNFDWLMTTGNFIKVLEGTYDNKDTVVILPRGKPPDTRMSMIENVRRKFANDS